MPRPLKNLQPLRSTSTIFMIMYCDYIFPSLIVHRQIRHRRRRYSAIAIHILMGLLFAMAFLYHIQWRGSSGRTAANHYSFPILCTRIFSRSAHICPCAHTQQTLMCVSFFLLSKKYKANTAGAFRWWIYGRLYVRICVSKDLWDS